MNANIETIKAHVKYAKEIESIVANAEAEMKKAQESLNVKVQRINSIIEK